MDENPFKPPPDLNSYDHYRFIPWVLDSQAFFTLALLCFILAGGISYLILRFVGSNPYSTLLLGGIATVGVLGSLACFFIGLYLWVRE